MSDFTSRAAWLEYRDRPKGLPVRIGAVRTKAVGNKYVAVPTALGNNQRKREIPSKRKHRVRLRAHFRGDLRGRPLTAHERSWL